MKALIICAMVVLFSGCTTLQDAKNAKGTGEYRVYAHPYDNVWDAAVNVVNTSNLNLVSKNKSEGEILAQKGMSAFSYGENVAVFVEPENAEETKVEVVSKRALSTNIVAKDWTDHILERIAELLN